MNLIRKLFGMKSSRSRLTVENKPAVHGGDASSPSQAAVVNCASMAMANQLIVSYISERNGVIDVDWKRKVEFFVKWK